KTWLAFGFPREVYDEQYREPSKDQHRDQTSLPREGSERERVLAPAAGDHNREGAQCEQRCERARVMRSEGGRAAAGIISLGLGRANRRELRGLRASESARAGAGRVAGACAVRFSTIRDAVAAAVAFAGIVAARAQIAGRLAERLDGHG